MSAGTNVASPDLLRQLREASGLSRVFADVFIERACEMAGCTPHTLQPGDLPALLPSFERALGIFLRGDRLDEAITRLRAMAA